MCVCVCVGDAAVGKTALSHLFNSDGSLFQKNYSMVRGLDAGVLQFYTEVYFILY